MTKTFYNSRINKEGKRKNFVDSITGTFKLVKKHMGGNYGRADEYIVQNKEGTFNMQYYGDGSAKITKL